MSETNYEHFKQEIERVILSGDSLALTSDGVACCHDISCGECKCFRNSTIPCREQIINWLNSEYKVSKPKLTPADHRLVSILKNGYIARDKDGALYWFSSKPNKNDFLWRSESSRYVRLSDSYFCECNFLTFIKWEDPEPWCIEDLLKLEVEK